MAWIERADMKGPTGTIDYATAVELAPTADPTVTLGGTPQNRIMTLGIPRGHAVTSAVIGGDGRLRLGMTTGETLDVGVARGAQGLPGFEGVQSDAGMAQLVELPSATRTALEAHFAPVVSLAGRGVSHLNTAAANTAAAQAAIVEAEALRATVVFPATPPGAFIDLDGPLTVTGGIAIRGAGRHLTRLRQTSFPNMIFDVIGPDVLIEHLGFHQDITKFAEGPSFTGEFRGGSPYYSFNAGVWVGADRVTVRNVHAEGLVTGVNVASWDVTAGAARAALTGCSVEDLTVTSVVFGLVVAGVSGFSFSKISGDYYLPAGIGTPPHLVYFVEFRGTNLDVKGSSCYAVNGQTSYAYQFKGVTRGRFDKLTARNTRGLLHTMYCEDLTFNTLASFEDTWLTELAGSVELEVTNNRVEIDGLVMTVAGTGKPVRFSATTTNSILKNATIVSNHVVAPTSGGISYDVEISGTHNTADSVSVTNVGTQPWDASIGDWSGADHIIRRPRTAGNNVGVTVRSRAGTANARIEDYDLTELGSTLALPLTVSALAKLAPRASFAERLGANRLIAYDDGSLPANSVGTITRTPSGHPWVQEFGTWAADGSHIYATSGASATATLDLGVANVDACVGLRYQNREALLLREINKSNTLAVRLNHTTNVYELVSFNAAAGTVLASAPVTVSIGRRYELRTVIYGTVIDAYLDGRWMFAYTLTGGDATKFVGTKHGLMSAAGDAAGKFDNIVFRRTD